MAEKPSSLAARAFWIARYRPAAFVQALRGYLRFARARFWMRVWKNAGLELGRNVRVQRAGSLQAELPDARIRIGDHSIVYENALLEAYGAGRIELGACAVLGDIRISARYGVRVGQRFITSWNVFIQDFDPHPTEASVRGRQVEAICGGFRPRYAVTPFSDKNTWGFPGVPIEIGDDVWIGANATILKGAQIGSGSIVATGSVVLAGEYPPRSLIAGNPAKIVKTLS